MAERGATYSEILAHYYGGLTPVSGEQFLPEQVSVGLVVGADFVSVDTGSFLTITLDGEQVAVPDPGAWTFQWEDGRLLVISPSSDTPRVPLGSPNVPV
jgi:hypothetical protein